MLVTAGGARHCLPVLLAGGQGSRLHELTDTDCKPAVWFGRPGGRIVDFVTGALRQAGFDRMVVGTQYRPASLVRYLERSWQPAFASGLLFRDGAWFGKGYRGTADVLLRNLHELDAINPDEIMVLAGDHVFDADLRLFLEEHRAAGAAATVAATPVPVSEAHGFGIFETAMYRVVGFAEKPARPTAMPSRPSHALASMGIYIFEYRWLRSALQDLEADPASRFDFGHDIVPRALARGELALHALPDRTDRTPGYWRDVGTLDAYRQTQLAFERDRPLLQPLPPIADAAAPAAIIARTAQIDESIALPGSYVGSRCRLRRAIVGTGARLPDGLVIGEDPVEDSRWFRRTPAGTTLVTSEMLVRREADRPRTHHAA